MLSIAKKNWIAEPAILLFTKYSQGLAKKIIFNTYLSLNIWSCDSKSSCSSFLMLRWKFIYWDHNINLNISGQQPVDDSGLSYTTSHMINQGSEKYPYRMILYANALRVFLTRYSKYTCNIFLFLYLD